MRITITIKQKNPAHITFQVFVEGGLSGQLVLRTSEWDQFMSILQPDKIRDETEGNPECKRCGLLKSTVDDTDAKCIPDKRMGTELEGVHDFTK